MDIDIDTVDTPLAIIVSIAISFIIALILLVTAPALLIDYGLAIGYAYAVVMGAWIGIEALHSDFEDEQEARLQAALDRQAWAMNATSSAYSSMGEACRQATLALVRFSAAWNGIEPENESTTPKGSVSI